MSAPTSLESASLPREPALKLFRVHVGVPLWMAIIYTYMCMIARRIINISVYNLQINPVRGIATPANRAADGEGRNGPVAGPPIGDKGQARAGS